jgi:hypothetical protein
MNDNNPPASWPDRAVGLGAGLASALLFIVSTRGSGLALALAYFAPLPLMIGAAGFSLPGALIGALIGAGVLLAAAHAPFALAFLFGFAAPALALAAMIQSPLPSRDRESAAARFAMPGEMLEIIILLSILVAGAGVAILLVHYHGFEPAMSAVMKHFAPALDNIAKDLAPVSSEIGAEGVKRLAVMSAPAGVAASQVMLLAVNLWLAARTIDISGRLRRPWPSLPETLALPRLLGPIFLVAAGLVFKGGLIGMLTGIVAAALGFGFAFHGLAAVHGLTRDVGLRGAWLAALYAVAMVLEPWSIIFLALFGVIESAFSLRARKARRRVKTRN